MVFWWGRRRGEGRGKGEWEGGSWDGRLGGKGYGRDVIGGEWCG